MLDTHMPDSATRVASKVPAGCWIDQSDWSDWPQGDHACSPNEWPYNLEAPQGSREFAGIIGWFIDKHPRLHEPDIGDCLKLVNESAPNRQVTAQVDCDPETGHYELRFTIYECLELADFETVEMERYWAREAEMPQVRALSGHVWVTASTGPFPGTARER